jgi:6-phosphogluconolactonase
MRRISHGFIMLLGMVLLSLLVNATNKKDSDSIYFYVGTYTDNQSEGIYLFSLNRSSGILTNHGLAARSQNPSFLTMTKDQRFLLAVNEIKDTLHQSMGAIESFSVDAQSKKLTPISKVFSGGAHPCFISVDQSGYVLTANYTGGNFAMFKLNDSGKLSNYIDLNQHVGSGPIRERQASPHVHSAYFEPFTNRVFVADLGTDQIGVSILDQQNSKLLKPEISTIQIKPGSGPRHIAFHSALKLMYVVNELSNDISVIALNKDNTFTTIETISTLPTENTTASNCADIHLSKDNKFLYASNRGFNSIAIFSVDQLTGRLTLIGQEMTHGKTPRNFSLSPDNDFLVVANQNSEDIVSFKRNSTTGKLEFSDQIKAFKPVCILFPNKE